MAQIAVVGTTSWGTTLGLLVARKGLPTYLWARRRDEADRLTADGEHRRFLPGIPFPATLTVTADAAAALHDAHLVILAVPSQTMRANLRAIRDALPPTAILLSVAKGLEVGTSLRMSQVIAEEVDPALHGRIGVLSGPNLSREVAQQLPSAAVVACQDEAVAETVQDIVRTRFFRAYVSRDVVGVELGGALKNIIALGAGMSDGWGYGDNAKAAFMTRGLAEITRLGVAAGANPLTFQGLAGLGDLVATCTSPLSRNRRAGEGIAHGRSVAEVLAGLGGTAEGIPTTQAAYELATRLGVEMPITAALYRVLFQGSDPRQAVVELLSREPHHELYGLER
ncbi:MAG: NAD(P)-dependent glycerol-3-phosphate dehydrogenase [Chloroflexi bacterium]|nr:NAD(P)-dependent glycerol-3-phosphate dehydrogenase [Chloroflexota bacterium]